MKFHIRFVDGQFDINDGWAIGVLGPTDKASVESMNGDVVTIQRTLKIGEESFLVTVNGEVVESVREYSTMSSTRVGSGRFAGRTATKDAGAFDAHC